MSPAHPERIGVGAPSSTSAHPERRGAKRRGVEGPSHLLRAALPLALALCTTACGPKDQQLEGSLSEVLDLSFRKVDVAQGESDLAVRFVQPQGAGENVVLRVAVSLLGTAVDADEPLDLAEPDALGNTRGKATRAVVDDPLQELPPIARGELVFHKTLLSGQTVPGEVHLTFSEGTTLANGRTVFGTFEAKVQ